MKWVINRLKEPSTWAGFAGLIPAVFVATSAPITPDVIGALVASIAAVLMREAPHA